MSVSSLDPATPSSRRTGRRVRSQSRASSVETGITNGGTVAGSIADDELPQFDDENELLGDDDENAGIDDDEEDGEELFGDNMEADYRPIAALDRYDGADLDESDYDAISESGRREAERMMKKRDKDLGVGQMRRGLFYGTVLYLT